MVQPHLIVLDLDGTLLTDEKVISEKTKRTKGSSHFFTLNNCTFSMRGSITNRCTLYN